jgi:catechol 2,3-dioxygenase-like lactoylglutathione lyase family enzyme
MTSVNVRYMVDDVEAAVAFYTTHLGFTLISSAAPAFADVSRGDLRLLLSGATSSAGRPMPDGRQPTSGGWNRFQIVVDDIASEVARLRAAGVRFRNDIVKGPGGAQILVEDPSGNVVELFQPRGGSVRLPRPAEISHRRGDIVTGHAVQARIGK